MPIRDLIAIIQGETEPGITYSPQDVDQYLTALEQHEEGQEFLAALESSAARLGVTQIHIILDDTDASGVKYIPNPEGTGYIAQVTISARESMQSGFCSEEPGHDGLTVDLADPLGSCEVKPFTMRGSLSHELGHIINEPGPLDLRESRFVPGPDGLSVLNPEAMQAYIARCNEFWGTNYSFDATNPHAAFDWQWRTDEERALHVENWVMNQVFGQPYLRGDYPAVCGFEAFLSEPLVSVDAQSYGTMSPQPTCSAEFTNNMLIDFYRQNEDYYGTSQSPLPLNLGSRGYSFSH